MLDAARATCYAGRMRRLAILIGLVTAACGSTTRGPAWPKSASDGPDGGESIAPKPGSVMISANEPEEADDDVVEVASDKPASSKPAASEDKSSDSTTPTITAPEEIINTDDLVIEIDD